LPRRPRDVQVKAVSAVQKQQHIEYRVPATALLWLSVHAGDARCTCCYLV